MDDSNGFGNFDLLNCKFTLKSQCGRFGYHTHTTASKGGFQCVQVALEYRQMDKTIWKLQGL